MGIKFYENRQQRLPFWLPFPGAYPLHIGRLDNTASNYLRRLSEKLSLDSSLSPELRQSLGDLVLRLRSLADSMYILKTRNEARRIL